MKLNLDFSLISPIFHAVSLWISALSTVSFGFPALFARHFASGILGVAL